MKKLVVKDGTDPFVLANISLGLIGQGVMLDIACDRLHHFLQEEELIMFDSSSSSNFVGLLPSTVKHNIAIHNYPELINQLTRLRVLETLVIYNPEKAQEAIKHFLSSESWGVSGEAAVLLLQEGNAIFIELVKDLLHSESAKLRLQAALVLASLSKDSEALVALHESYEEASSRTKIQILEALGSIASKKSIPFLTKVLDSPFATERVVAASSLLQCLNK
jgi:hypothetical protein